MSELMIELLFKDSIIFTDSGPFGETSIENPKVITVREKKKRWNG